MIFDPRAKLYTLLICILVTIFPHSGIFQFYLMILLMVMGIIMGKWKLSVTAMLIYTLITGIIWYAGVSLTGSTLGMILIAGLGFFLKIFPCGTCASIIISTTKVSELLTAAVKLRIPQKIYIPLAVMCRYFPVIREDWRFIRGAMKLRGIYLSPRSIIKKPVMTVECLYVPLMMSASKAADELSAAAVSRGIENPMPRTCVTELRFKIKDISLMLIYTCMFVIMFFV